MQPSNPILKQRLRYMDFAKGIAIFLVVWGHCMQNLTTDSNYWLTDPISQFIISFHMPLFMVISGFFAYNSLSRAFGEVVKKKFVQLIIPSVIWFLIISFITLVTSRNFTSDRMLQILFSIPHSYWFLKSLFMCYLITMVGYMTYKRNSLLFCVYCVSIFLLGEHLNYVSTISMLPFFLFGVILNRYQHKIYAIPQIMTVSVSLFAILFFLYDGAEYNLYINQLNYNDLMGGVNRIWYGH